MKTLHKLILAAGLLLSAQTGIAQATFGLKAGMNVSNVYDERGDDFVADAKLGAVVGAQVYLPIVDFLGFQPELLFSQRGFRATGVINGWYYEMKRTTNFLDIPLMFVIRATPTFAFVAGPQFSYLMSQRDVFTNSTNTIAVEQVFRNDNPRRNLACFVGGFDVTAGNIIVGARGGIDVQDNQGDGSSGTPRYKNTWVQLTVGANF